MSQNNTLQNDMPYKVGDKVKYVRRGHLPNGWTYLSSNQLGKIFVIDSIDRDGKLRSHTAIGSPCYLHKDWVESANSWVAARKIRRK